MEKGFYYLKRKDEAPVLVYGYNCTDLGGQFVFGFNTYDGGGLLPLSDLSDETVVIPVVITEVVCNTAFTGDYMRGFSMWFSVGKWAGFQIDFCRVTWFRIVVGWFSFAILGCDIDRVIAYAVKSRADAKESAVQQPTPQGVNAQSSASTVA